MLAKFPRGYTLYVHIKGLKRDQLNARKDYYLYGESLHTILDLGTVVPHTGHVISAQDKGGGRPDQT